MEQEKTNQSEYNRLCQAKANWLDLIFEQRKSNEIDFVIAYLKLDEEDQNLLDEHYEKERN